GASKILPVAFLVIVATVALYGLTGMPVARRLRVTRPARTRPLLIGGDPWVIDLARALRAAGLDVLMWAASNAERTQLKAASCELAPGELLASATGQGAKVEGVTAILMLTEEDDFNALAATTLAADPDTPVYRLAPREPSHGVVAPYTAGAPPCTPDRTRPHQSARTEAGAQIAIARANGSPPPGSDVLFLIKPEGTLIPVTTTQPPTPQPGDTLVLLTGGE